MPARMYMIMHCKSSEHPDGLPLVDIFPSTSARDLAAFDHANKTAHAVELSTFIAAPATHQHDIIEHLRKAGKPDPTDPTAPFC